MRTRLRSHRLSIPARHRPSPSRPPSCTYRAHGVLRSPDGGDDAELPGLLLAYQGSQGSWSIPTDAGAERLAAIRDPGPGLAALAGGRAGIAPGLVAGRLDPVGFRSTAWRRPLFGAGVRRQPSQLSPRTLPPQIPFLIETAYPSPFLRYQRAKVP